MQRKRVLFFCTQNSAGSQMAGALLQQEAADRFEVFSAGTDPTDVRPEAIAVMAEIGIDIRRQCAKAVDEFKDTMPGDAAAFLYEAYRGLWAHARELGGIV